MSLATDSIQTVKDAIKEYGSNIILREETEGEYDPYNPNNGTIADTPTKGIFKSSVSENIRDAVPKAMMELFEKVVIVDSDVEIEKDKHKILYKDIAYEIVWFSDPILQDEVLLYELLIKK